MTAKARFKQADLERALKGVMAAGLKISRLEINEDGSFQIVINNDESGAADRGRKLVDRLYGAKY